MAVDPKRKLHYRKTVLARATYVWQLCCLPACLQQRHKPKISSDARRDERNERGERAIGNCGAGALEPFAYLAICINTSVWGHYVISSRPDSYCCSMSTAMSKRDSAAWSPGLSQTFIVLVRGATLPRLPLSLCLCLSCPTELLQHLTLFGAIS